MLKKTMKTKALKRLTNCLVIVSLLVSIANFMPTAQAAVVTSFSDNLSRLRTSTLADHTIKFITPTGLAGGQAFTLTFDADFTMGSFAVANFDLATGTSCTSIGTERTLGTGAPSGSTWQVGQVGQVVTFTSGTDTITAGHCVEVQIGANATSGGSGTTQITNPSSAQTATLAVSVNSGADSGTAGIAIIDTPFDQVTVTANVDPTISFAVSDSTIGFGTLSSSDDRFATGDTNGNSSETVAHNLQVATNATSGYTLYVQGGTLTSGANTIDAIGGSATASTTNSEQFGMKLVVNGGGGAGSPVAPYNTANYAYNATASTQDDIASHTGPSATRTFDVTYVANITGATEAGSYTSTLTFTGTGTF